MKEKYYKVHKDVATRAGLNAKLREEVDEDFLLLSGKDIRMITLTLEERLHGLSLCAYCNEEDLGDDVETEDVEDDIDEDDLEEDDEYVDYEDIDEDDSEDDLEGNSEGEEIKEEEEENGND